MRCITCGEVMRLVQAVSDQGMMVPGYEHLTYECPGCHEVERRLTFKTAQSEEQAAAPPLPPPAPPVPAPEPQAPAAPSAWELAQEKVQARQVDLQNRADLVRQAEAADQFHRDWERLVPARRLPIRRVEQTAAKPSQPSAPSAAVKTAPPRPPGPLERVATKLRHYAAKRGIEPQNPHVFSRFDQFWEDLTPRPAALDLRAAEVAATPPKSNSRVPVETPPRAGEDASRRK
jgi:hypothetical protein